MISCRHPREQWHGFLKIDLFGRQLGLGSQFQAKRNTPFLPQFYNLIKCDISSIAAQWGTVAAGIKDPSIENLKFKDSPFKVWSRSEYSRTCFTYCQELLPWTIFYLLGPFIFYFFSFFQSLFRIFPGLAVANTDSCVGQQNKIGHVPVVVDDWCRFPCWVPTEFE